MVLWEAGMWIKMSSYSCDMMHSSFYLFGCSHSIDWPQMDQLWCLFVLHWSCGVTSQGIATTMSAKWIKLDLDFDLGLKLCSAHDWLNLNLLSANLPKQGVYEVINDAVLCSYLYYLYIQSPYERQIFVCFHISIFTCKLVTIGACI